MKRILFYVSVVILAIVMGFILSRIKPKKVVKLVTIDTEYSFLMGDGELANVLYYVNDDAHELTDINAFARIVLEDHLSLSKVELTLYDLEVGHEEVYLGETFKRIILTFMVPKLTEDWIFDDAYLKVETKMQESYEMRLGRVSFFQRSFNDLSYNWQSLDGRKHANDLRSRLGEIDIEFENKIPNIKNIEIGTKAPVTHKVSDTKLTISITQIDYLLYEVPVILTFMDGSKLTISHFRYMIDYMMLKESGPLINVYTLD